MPIGHRKAAGLPPAAEEALGPLHPALRLILAGGAGTPKQF